MIPERCFYRSRVLRTVSTFRWFLREFRCNADILKVPVVRQLHPLCFRGSNDYGLRLQPAKVTMSEGLLPLQATDEDSRTDVNGERGLLD